jgi:hypothetical protein
MIVRSRSSAQASKLAIAAAVMSAGGVLEALMRA